MSEIHFPFTAVAGQHNFKLALILAAINPAIGGVVISGPRGCAKSTLARGLADLLPTRSDNQTPEFVTLPLGCSEEMLLGTLDLQKVLDDQNVAFLPGLLSRAHGGVLYVDEVNLLPDALVDQLLDVAASGVNRVERDGISHSHAARFMLIGTMNPDEGELRPQLHDRFGLCVELSNQFSPQERVEIVKAREAFDRNPPTFCAHYADEQAALVEAVTSARIHLHDVECSDALRLEIAERCSAAQVDGLRADIVWYRAALAHAAWQGRCEVNMADIDVVEALVLAHRRKVSADHSANQPSMPPSASSPPSGGFKRPDSTRQPMGEQTQPSFNSEPQTDTAESPSNAQDVDSSGSEGDWGSMAPQQQRSAHLNADLNTWAAQSEAKANSAKAADAIRELVGRKAGPSKQGHHCSHTVSPKPNWFGTLIKNHGIWPPKTLRFQPARTGLSVLHLVVLDTSASTLGQGAESLGKGAVLKIAEQAYLQREQLSIFGFGNNQVEHLLPKVRAPKALRDWLDALPVAGGTPMRAAVEQVQNYLHKLQRQDAALEIRTYIITDGRSSARLDDLTLPGELVWIDIEQSAVKRGRGAQLADQLNAQYLPLATI